MSNQMILNSTKDNDDNNNNNSKITEDEYKKQVENEYEDVSDVESNSSNFSINEDKYSNRSQSVSENSLNNNNNNNNSNITSGSYNQTIMNDTSSKPNQPIQTTNALNNSIIRTPHLCNDCLRTFKDINNYKEHRFQEHHEKYPNVRQCNMCSYATLLKSKYDCHMRCHLNNKVIRCQRCNYSTINIRHMSKHERMHMITTQGIMNSTVPNLLNEKLLQINPFKRKCDQTDNEIKLNKYQKSSVSSSLSPSSISSTSSVNEVNNNIIIQNDSQLVKPTEPTLSHISTSNNNILQLIINNTNRFVNDDCKENHFNNNVTNPSTPSVYHNEYHQTQQLNSNETSTNTQQINLQTQSIYNPNPALISQYTLPLNTYLNKTNINYPITTALNYQSNLVSNEINLSNVNETSTHDTVDNSSSFPKNKYEKFLSNYNKQKSSIDSKENDIGDNKTNKKIEIINEKTESSKQSKEPLESVLGGAIGFEQKTGHAFLKTNDINKDIEEKNIMKLIEEKEKQNKCNLCSYKTKQKNNIYNHSKSHHHGETDLSSNVLNVDGSKSSNTCITSPNLVNNDEIIKQSSPNGIHRVPTSFQDNYDKIVDGKKSLTNNNINTQASATIIQQQQQQSFTSNLIQNSQSTVNIQNLFNTLRLPYPIPPTYLSLLAFQQQQQQSLINADSLAYQNCQYDIQKQQQQQQQQQTQQSLFDHSILMQQLLSQQLQPQSTTTTPQQPNVSQQNSFLIENLFSLKEINKKPAVNQNTYETLTPAISKQATINSTNENKNPIKCCDHKEELYLLRQNVYKMLYKNLPNVLLAFNLLNDPLSPQIDYILQSLLVYNQNSDINNNFTKEHPFEFKQFFNHYINKPLYPTTS